MSQVTVIEIGYLTPDEDASFEIYQTYVHKYNLFETPEVEDIIAICNREQGDSWNFARYSVNGELSESVERPNNEQLVELTTTLMDNLSDEQISEVFNLVQKMSRENWNES